MYDIVALGECLIDFSPSGLNEMGMPVYSQNPGGAPANVLAMAGRMGCKTAFIGKVGDDAFGDFLKVSFENAGIDCMGLVADHKHLTTLAFVVLDENGDRSFFFYREKGADLMLSESDVNISLLEQAKVFHFGSVSMTSEPTLTATVESVKKAKEFGSCISFDPNYRPFLWKDTKTAVEIIKSVIPLCDLLKVSVQELELLTGCSDVKEGSRTLSDMGPTIVVVTMGAEGSFVRRGDYTQRFRTFNVKTCDTTGAGDAFWGSFLWKMTVEKGCSNRQKILTVSTSVLEEAMVFANAAGSLATTARGAIPAIPSFYTITDCIESNLLL